MIHESMVRPEFEAKQGNITHLEFIFIDSYKNNQDSTDIKSTHEHFIQTRVPVH